MALQGLPDFFVQGMLMLDGNPQPTLARKAFVPTRCAIRSDTEGSTGYRPAQAGFPQQEGKSQRKGGVGQGLSNTWDRETNRLKKG